MWINEYIAARSGEKEESVIGRVGAVQNGRVDVSATRGYHHVSLILPEGVVSIPRRGAGTVVVQSSGGAVCPGVIIQPPSNLEPGELMLRSAGGASIVLKNDGRVLINGREVQ